jgi:hypothetical protein
MKTKKLPQTVVVTIEDEGTSDEYLSVTKQPFDATTHGVKKRAGLYVLKELINIEGVTRVTPGK